MKNWFKRVKTDGLSLRLTFLCMLIVSIGITVFLLITTLLSFRSFRSLSRATDAYIELQDTASTLLHASDYLTEEVQRYTVLEEREYLEGYFREALEAQRREKAVAAMEESLPESEALTRLKAALAESVHLMDREYYAMRLVLDATGDEDIPEALRDISLSAQDLALPAAEKLSMARRLVHDDGYYSQKNAIRDDLEQCLDNLKLGTHAAQDGTEQQMKRDLVWLSVFIVLQSLFLILMLWLTTSLGINPLLTAVEHIKKDQSLPIVGAHEFRYLAGTYNKMYTAYKKSIDNLSFKASHDELTGVYNRAGYDLIKDGVDKDSTAFLLFDADRFKSINDTYGHEIGDRVLQRIAKVLLDNFRADDYVCRIGGDEFMVLMVHVKKEVARLIENKVSQINRDLSSEADGLPAISLSVGISMGRADADPTQMFREADTALYYVKDHGRDGCCFYSSQMRLPEHR